MTHTLDEATMAMTLVEAERMEPRAMESMEEMGGNMVTGLRAELHSAEVQLSHWVAEREQRLGDLQVCYALPRKSLPYYLLAWLIAQHLY